MQMKYSYCAVVVAYNPDASIINNINSYSKRIGKIYVIDNSTEYNEEIVMQYKKNKKIEYITMNGNAGLAEALIKGCDLAVKDGFDYIETMDQDSKFILGADDVLIDYVEASCEEKLAIVAPCVIAVEKNKNGMEDTRELFKFDGAEKTFPWVMTSGSLMNLQAYKRVGEFDPKLFVDHIDIDIGIKFYKNGYRIIRVQGSKIYQHLGRAQERTFVGKKIYPNFDHPVRTYYIARNQYYILKTHGKKFRKITNVSYAKMLIKILLYEDRRLEKLKMFFCGIYDGIEGNMGKCRYI